MENPFKFTEAESVNLIKCWNVCRQAIESFELNYAQRKFLISSLSNDLFLDMTETPKPNNNA